MAALPEEMIKHIMQNFTDKELLSIRQIAKRFQQLVDATWSHRDPAFKKIRYSDDKSDYVRDRFLYASMKKYFLLIAKHLQKKDKTERENVAHELKTYIEKNKESLPVDYLDCLKEAYKDFTQDHRQKN